MIPTNASTTLRNVASLSGLSLLAAGAPLMMGLGLFAQLAPPGMDIAGMLVLVAAQMAYLWFAAVLAGQAIHRHALALQVQALIHILYALLLVPACVAIFYFMASLDGDTVIQEMLREKVASDRTRAGLIITALALPTASMLLAAWRLHHLAAARALASFIDGSLLRRTVLIEASTLDSGDAVHDLLLRHLERLADRSLPSLGRPMYGSHPRITTRDAGGRLVHELVWRDCPNLVEVSLLQDGAGNREIAVRCRLRGGGYRLSLSVTPVDALVQMQHIDAHLLAPLRARLAELAAERQRDALRERALEAQLRILQAQIEPHFLFNTLANLRQLYRIDAAGGEQMLDHLIGYLRSTMDELRADVSSVRREFDLASHYLALMKIRMGDRLAYTFTVPDALLEHPVPPAMLISLVENAIKHGLPDAAHGQVTLTASASEGQLRLGVADNGAGLSSVGGSGVGLSNIRRRLEALYGNRAWLEVGAPEQGGFAATIVIPLIEENPACPPH